MLVHHGAWGVGLKRRPAGHHVIKRRPQRINISAEIDVHIAANLLGADVIRRAIRLARLALGRFLVIQRARQTQIGQLGHALRRVSRMFLGFTSRWISPRSCACASASVI
jgi:hypothetical protein